MVLHLWHGLAACDGPCVPPCLPQMAAEYLARVAGIQSVDDFVNEMFRAKSDTDGLDIREVPGCAAPRHAGRCDCARFLGLTPGWRVFGQSGLSQTDRNDGLQAVFDAQAQARLWRRRDHQSTRTDCTQGTRAHT